jgi:hypothetical protein
MARRAENVVAFYNKRGTCDNGSKSFPRPRLFQPKQKAEAEASGLLRDKSKFGAAEKFRAAITTCRLAGYPSCFTIVSIVQHRPCPGRWGESDVY